MFPPFTRVSRLKEGGWVDTFLLNVHGKIIDVFNHRGVNRPLLRQHRNSVSSLEWRECGEPLYPQQLASHSIDLDVERHRRNAKGLGAVTSRMMDDVARLV